MTKAACCRNIEIVQPPSTLSYISCVVEWCFFYLLYTYIIHILVHIYYIYIYNIEISLIYVVFWINVMKICKPLSKLDLPTLRKGCREERTQRNKWKIWNSLGFEPRSSACRADALPTKLPVPVGRTRILIPMSFETSNSFRRILLFIWNFHRHTVLLIVFVFSLLSTDDSNI